VCRTGGWTEIEQMFYNRAVNDPALANPYFPEAEEEALLDLLDDADEDEGASPSPPAPNARLAAAARGWEALSPVPRLGLTPRPYQEDALAAWSEAGGRGVVVLPTGAGKTVVAMMAVAAAGVRPLVVVPTIELLKQWSEGLSRHLSLPPEAVGQVGGGARRIGPATVITYDSAWRRLRELGAFGLLIFDEAHHLPSGSYRRIADSLKAPLRLGLTATPERGDFRHHDLDRLVGPVVFRRSPGELSRSRHIARFRQERLFVDLTDEEEYEYHELMTRFRWYMARNRMWGGGYQNLVMRAATDPGAREAIRCHQQARQVALNSRNKAAKVLDLLRAHEEDRVLVFCEYTSVVDALSHRLLLPSVTYRTPPAERRLTLQRFRSGVYTKVVTGRVLNEGVDVPDANVAIVVSGSGTPREQIQRLGRVLRPKEEEAVLYEIVARGTVEERSARSRRVKE
jgi:superfamily II DNA or RNA helicase